jgi:hypothetical protein
MCGKILPSLAVLWLCFSSISPAYAQPVHGEIYAQQLDSQGNGYTILRLSGSYEEMGYAQGYLLGEEIDALVTSIKSYLTDIDPSAYALLKAQIAATALEPSDVLDEIDGLLAGVQAAVPASTIDAGDIKMANTYGDWSASPLCRSHSCWGSYVTAPVKTLSSRRLDYATPPMFGSINHVLTAYAPSDAAKVKWVNLGFPGTISVATAVNEYGTISSLHDYQTSGAHGTGNVITRSMAARYVLTMNDLPAEISLQLDHVYAGLSDYRCWTGTFINYYVPEGHGGVITANQTQGFYKLRTPEQSYYGGDVLVTSNQETDGTYTPSDATSLFPAYYDDPTPKTLDDHWGMLHALGSHTGFHQMSVEYRSREDMTIRFQGRLQGTDGTAVTNVEWSDLFGGSAVTHGVGQMSTMAHHVSLMQLGRNLQVTFVPTFSGNATVSVYGLQGTMVARQAKAVVSGEKQCVAVRPLSPVGAGTHIVSIGVKRPRDLPGYVLENCHLEW